MASKFFRRIVLISILLVGLFIALFAVNGMYLANDDIPLAGVTEYGTSMEAPTGVEEITIMAYNIAKGFVYLGGVHFETPDRVVTRLWKIADLINKVRPDIVFLSETVFECGPSPVNQVTFLARATRMHSWLFGENYNFGLPYYRIVGGNAILSRWPLKAVANPPLAGRKPFYLTKNNRRILWGELEINGENILLGSVHTDSFNLTNNLTQTQQILDYIGEKPAIIAGDFNANPAERPIRIIQESGQFSGAIEGPLTFPALAPEQRIDFIFAPNAWELVTHRVPKSDASDHFPVVSTFRLPE